MASATKPPLLEVGSSRRSRLTLRFIALLYLFGLLALPLGLIVYRTFEHGIGPVWDALTQPYAIHALKVTLEVALTAVVLNTAFGIGASLLIVRRRFKGRRVFDALIDLPVAVSPVVVGLALILVYGKFSTVGGWLEANGIQIIFSLPGMVIATCFVSLPLVVRESHRSRCWRSSVTSRSRRRTPLVLRRSRPSSGSPSHRDQRSALGLRRRALPGARDR